MTLLATVLFAYLAGTPQYQLQWAAGAGPYYDVYVGAKGAETLARITAAISTFVPIPVGECAYVVCADAMNTATCAASAEVCPTFARPTAPGGLRAS